MPQELPAAARTVDPALSDIGAGLEYQQVVFGKVQPPDRAFVVVRLVKEHPDGAGVIGRCYGTTLKGLLLGSTFRPWASEGLGEVGWDGADWVQVAVRA